MNLNKSLIFLAMVTAGTALAAGPQENTSAAGTGGQSSQSADESKTHAYFERLDKDHDRNLSKQEAQKNDQLVSAFEKIDKDDDGVLSAEEFGRWEGSAILVQQAGREMFKQLDKDRDQNVSRPEAQQDEELVRAFDELDTDRDGVLGAEELSAWQGSASDPQSAQAKFDRLDEDRDRNLSKQEARSDSEVVQAFEQIDKDSDGVLSAEEFGQWSEPQKEE